MRTWRAKQDQWGKKDALKKFTPFTRMSTNPEVQRSSKTIWKLSFRPQRIWASSSTRLFSTHSITWLKQKPSPLVFKCWDSWKEEKSRQTLKRDDNEETQTFWRLLYPYWSYFGSTMEQNPRESSDTWTRSNVQEPSQDNTRNELAAITSSHAPNIQQTIARNDHCPRTCKEFERMIIRRIVLQAWSVTLIKPARTPRTLKAQPSARSMIVAGSEIRM